MAENRETHMMNVKHRVAVLAGHYSGLQNMLARCAAAADDCGEKICGLLRENNVKALLDPVTGISVFRKEEAEYQYDVDAIRKILGEDFHRIAAIDEEKFEEAAGDYPLIMNCRTKTGEISRIAVVAHGKK